MRRRAGVTYRALGVAYWWGLCAILEPQEQGVIV